MQNKFYTFILIATLISGSIIASTSCRKKGDTIARITVRDSVNQVVPNATVILGATSTTDPQQPVAFGDTATTNNSGIAIFNFNDVYKLGQAGVGVFDVVATKSGFHGESIIKVEEEKVNESTVFLR